MEKVVTDIMHPLTSYPSVFERESLGRILGLMADVVKDKKRHHLIVVESTKSEKKVIKGFITPREIVFGVAGHFLEGAENIGPIYWEGQLQSECMESFRKHAGEIMEPIKACINGSERIMEAIFLLKRYQLLFLPVVRCEEVIGIIHLDDILEEIVSMASE